MYSSETGIDRAASSAFSVLQAGRDLAAALDDPDQCTYTAERLAAAMDFALADQARTDADAEYYEPDETAPATGPELMGSEELLVVAISRLRIAEVAFAAGRALGEEGAEPDSSDLSGALTGLSAAAGALDEHRLPEPVDRGFAAVVRNSPDLPTAVDSIRKAVAEALDLIAREAADVLTRPLAILGDMAPARVQDAWHRVNERWGFDKIGGRLTRLGVRVLSSALEALHGLVAMPLLGSALEKLAELSRRLADHSVSEAVMGWLLAVESIKDEVGAALRHRNLRITTLDNAADRLDALGSRFRSTCDQIAFVQGGVAAIGAVKAIGIAVPHIGLILAGFDLLVGALAIVLAMDYVDVGSAHGLVRGVRTIVQEAVATP